MKKILITNDDGLDSPGLATLAEELLRTGLYELRVVAPEREQSGVGHCITLHTPLYAELAKLNGPLAAVPAYRVAGTPADCVKLAITNLFPDFAPDLVLSGINRGPNVGMNVLYSGTVAGALEACINSLPAAALSLDVPQSGIWNFRLAAELCLPIVAEIFTQGLPAWSALNVNVPNIPQREIKGVKLTRHGLSAFKEYYVEEPREGARRRFRLEGTMVFRDSDPDLDAVALGAGWVSVTPLGLGMLHNPAYKQLSTWKIFK